MNIKEIYKKVDQEVENILQKPEVHPTCKRGCDACCYYKATITPPEADILAEWVLAQDDADARLRQMSETMRRKEVFNASDAEWAALHIPCPFLKHHDCEVYDLRPVPCRTHMVMSDPGKCSIPGEINRAINLFKAEAVLWKETDKEGIRVAAPIQLMVLYTAYKLNPSLVKDYIRNLPTPEEWLIGQFMNTEIDTKSDAARAIMGAMGV